jgi:hypothetical protein
MTTEGNAEARLPPGADGDSGSRQQLTVAVSSQRGPPQAPASPDSGHRRLRNGQRLRSSFTPARPPDLGALAREAVVGFLHDASMATAQREATRTGGAVTDIAVATATPTGNAVTGGAGQTSSHSVAESAAWRAAAVSIATLDRIEATAAKVEADIAAALQAHAELQAGAGIAAEGAIHAAQSAWVAANSAVEADSRAKIALRRVEHYVTITVALVVITLIVLVVSATSVH